MLKTSVYEMEPLTGGGALGSGDLPIYILRFLRLGKLRIKYFKEVYNYAPVM